MFFTPPSTMDFYFGNVRIFVEYYTRRYPGGRHLATSILVEHLVEELATKRNEGMKEKSLILFLLLRFSMSISTNFQSLTNKI